MGSFDIVLHDLQIIAQLRPGYKITYTTGRMCVDPPDKPWRPVLRAIAGASRNSTLQSIQKSMELTFALTDLLLLSNNSEHKQKIKDIQYWLEAAKNGLLHLCETYESDIVIWAALHQIIGRIDMVLLKLSNTIKLSTMQVS